MNFVPFKVITLDVLIPVTFSWLRLRTFLSEWISARTPPFHYLHSLLYLKQHWFRCVSSRKKLIYIIISILSQHYLIHSKVTSSSLSPKTWGKHQKPWLPQTPYRTWADYSPALERTCVRAGMGLDDASLVSVLTFYGDFRELVKYTFNKE